MLKLVDIRKTFNPGTVNEKKALNGLNLDLKEGDFVTVIGGNGAGKSTMLNAIAGVWPVDEGEILIDGVNVTKLSEHKRAKYLGRVFQDPMTGTAATMEIEENMALAARRGLRRTLKSGINEAERERYKEKLKILDLGLEDRLTAKVGLLSGGQRHRGDDLRGLSHDRGAGVQYAGDHEDQGHEPGARHFPPHFLVYSDVKKAKTSGRPLMPAGCFLVDMYQKGP